MQSLLSLLKYLPSIFFPWKCSLCGDEATEEGGVCRHCLSSLSILPAWRCPVCGLALMGSAAECCSEGRKYSLDGLLSATGYEKEARRAIHLFKYSGSAPAGRTIGNLLADAVERCLDVPCDLIVPVPLARRRLRERGFNQAALIARRLGRKLSIPVSYRVLERIRDTSSQSGLSHGDRKANISGSIRLRRSLKPQGANVLIVDDVYTTGATMNECSMVLKKAGAASVFGTVFACVSRKGAL